MTGEHLEAILKTAHAKADKEGWQALPDFPGVARQELGMWPRRTPES